MGTFFLFELFVLLKPVCLSTLTKSLSCYVRMLYQCPNEGSGRTVWGVMRNTLGCNLATRDLAISKLVGFVKVASTSSTLVMRVTKDAGHLSTLVKKATSV